MRRKDLAPQRLDYPAADSGRKGKRKGNQQKAAINKTNAQATHTKTKKQPQRNHNDNNNNNTDRDNRNNNANDNNSANNKNTNNNTNTNTTNNNNKNTNNSLIPWNGKGPWPVDLYRGVARKINRDIETIFLQARFHGAEKGHGYTHMRQIRLGMHWCR
ncbi:unnamed protein product [Polarella glacialis]|uniref:Uncharacterized protein n=1 Tax=Polarella glacialis TaxID=89957 RepID=A0A813FNJ8_POLGL|nr:unnamed protein product [Polarella glacialis]CAE8695460.1 unnamed protein product [Polarella glacialis]